jgi:two-component sensor histidine kinase
LRRAIFLFLSVILLTLCASAKNGDNKTLDSLQNILSHASGDSAKCNAHLKICWHYIHYQINFDKAFFHAAEARKIAEKINNKNLLARTLNELGEVYDMKGDHFKARESLFNSLSIFFKNKDSASITSVEKKLGLSYYYQGKFDSSLFWNYEALKIEIKLNNKRGIADIYNNMGISEAVNGRKQKAIDYFKQAYSIFTESKDFYNAANVMNNIGDTYVELKKYDSAIFHILKALQIATKNNIQVEIRNSLVELGFCYNAMKQYTVALSYFERVKKDPETVTDVYDYANLLLGMSECYVGLTNYATAIKTAEQGIKLTSVADNNYYDIFSRFYKVLSVSYEGVKDYKKAVFFYKKYKAFNDSLLNEKNAASMNELSAKLEFQQKQQQIDLLKKENQLKDLSLSESKKKAIIYLIVLLFSILVIIILSVFYANKQSIAVALKEKNELISASLKERDVLLKEIHHRVKNNLQVISSLLNLQSKKIEDAKALEAITEAKNRIKTMALVHQNLYADKDLNNVNTKEYVENLIHSLFNSYKIDINDIELITDVDTIPMEIDTLVSMGLILNELISNALKYAFSTNSKGRLEVLLKKVNGNIILEVNDNGIGLPPDWAQKNTSLGYFIIYSFIKKVNGKINVSGDNGTKVRIEVSGNQKI